MELPDITQAPNAAVTRKKLLFLIADDFPTHRPDVTVLFGKELPRHGITSDIVAQCHVGHSPSQETWPPGRSLLCGRSGKRIKDQLTALAHDIRALWKAAAADYDAIQVRDKVFAGIAGLVRARQLGLPFFFWMSYPMSEGFIDISRRESLSLGLMRWAFVTIKGHLGRYLFYRFLLPRCDHVFAQSEHMAHMLTAKGIARWRITAVPMGVDLDQLGCSSDIPASIDVQLAGRLVIAYHGSMQRSRQIDLLFEALAIVRRSIPNVRLMLIGDATTTSERNWLEARSRQLGVADDIVWTGWLEPSKVWRLLRRADIGVSFIPRGELYDCSSPTKIVEYLALAVPVVANDLPDQKIILEASGAGICVTSDIRPFAAAIVGLLSDPELRTQMRSRGPAYIKKHRSYDSLGHLVAEVYARLLPTMPTGARGERRLRHSWKRWASRRSARSSPPTR